MKEIKITGFRIRYSGDLSAGVLPSVWEITGDFTFDNELDLEAFQQKLAEAWEYAHDTPVTVMSYEAISKPLFDPFTLMMCNHKAKDHLTDKQWLKWAEGQNWKGQRQQKCPSCGVWLFPCEM